jgi:hypothetical protein
MTQTTTTSRQTARAAVLAQVSARMRREHLMQYHKLHVRRDGTVNWFECINKSDDIIDGGANHFAAVPSVCCVGTGSCVCNCLHCDDKDYASQEEAISDAVLDADDSFAEAEMLAALDAIPVGYFDDETDAELNPEIADFCADNDLPLPTDIETANAAWDVADACDTTIQAQDMVRLFPGQPEMHTTTTFRALARLLR